MEKRIFILLLLITVALSCNKAPESLDKTSWMYEDTKLTFSDTTFQWAALVDTANGIYTYTKPTAIITINDIIFTCNLKGDEMTVGGNVFVKE